MNEENNYEEPSPLFAIPKILVDACAGINEELLGESEEPLIGDNKINEEDKVNEEFIEYWNDPEKKYKIMHLFDEIEENYNANGFSKNKLFYDEDRLCVELSAYRNVSSNKPFVELFFLELWLGDHCYGGVSFKSKKDLYEALEKLGKICSDFVKTHKMLEGS